MKTYLSIILTLTVFLFSCFSSKNKIQPQNISNENQTIESTSITLLQKGRLIYESKCNKCHALKDPISYTEPEWRKIVPRMTKMLNSRKVEMDSLSEATVLNYLIHATTNKK